MRELQALFRLSGDTALTCLLHMIGVIMDFVRRVPHWCSAQPESRSKSNGCSDQSRLKDGWRSFNLNIPAKAPTNGSSTFAGQSTWKAPPRFAKASFWVGMSGATLCGLLSRAAYPSGMLLQEYGDNSAATGAQPKKHLCGEPFPYSANEFMRRLAEVANARDLTIIPEIFERAYSTKLPHKRMSAGDRGAYRGWFAGDCQWYVPVRITNYRVIYDTKVRILVHINDFGFPRLPLRFENSGTIECLDSDTMTRLLKADGWRGGKWDLAGVESLLYRKAATEIDAEFGGSSASAPRTMCINLIDIRFTVAN
jgi:hypothetical protein